MAFLGSKASHLTCSYLIQDYLEMDGRALARDFLNLTVDEHDRWAKVMDRTRRMARCDSDYGGKKAVMYQHFVLSPDPSDNVSLADLRELTMSWVHEFFGDDSGDDEVAGLLGTYQVAVVYHDDNEQGIPHAHVIVNNTDLERDRRLHITDKENATLSNRLQQMCAERGFTYYTTEDDNPIRSKEGVFLTRAERELRKAGHYSWKDELRALIESARRFSTDTEGLIKRLDILGVGVEERGDDWLFVSPKNPTRRCSGYRLGRNYTKKYTSEITKRNQARHIERDTVLAQNVMAALRLILEATAKDGVASARPVVGDTKIHTVTADKELTIKDIADTLALNDEFNITCFADYGREGLRVKRLLGKNPSAGMAAVLQSDFKRLGTARDVAARSELFAGVGDTGSSAEARKHEQATLARISRQIAEGKDSSGGSGGRRAGQRSEQGGRKAAAHKQRT